MYEALTCYDAMTMSRTVRRASFEESSGASPTSSRRALRILKNTQRRAGHRACTPETPEVRTRSTHRQELRDVCSQKAFYRAALAKRERHERRTLIYQRATQCEKSSSPERNDRLSGELVPTSLISANRTWRTSQSPAASSRTPSSADKRSVVWRESWTSCTQQVLCRKIARCTVQV